MGVESDRARRLLQSQGVFDEVQGVWEKCSDQLLALYKAKQRHLVRGRALEQLGAARQKELRVHVVSDVPQI